MLAHTFCHIPGVGPLTEQKLWTQGVCTWHDAAAGKAPAAHLIRQAAIEAIDRLARGDIRYFAHRLPAREHWRLFADFRHRAAYLDIETTGLGAWDDSVTVIGLYDGRRLRHYIQGRNLDQFEIDVADYDLLVTYNGKRFDLPFIRRFLHVHLDQPHLDLMYVLRSLGYRGGLKAVERQLGLERPGLEPIDGWFAVRLWREYERTGEPRVLETLLAYNAQDVLVLEPLAVFAFNRKLQDTPFADTLRLPPAPARANPFRPAPEVIRRLSPSAGLSLPAVSEPAAGSAGVWVWHVSYSTSFPVARETAAPPWPRPTQEPDSPA